MKLSQALSTLDVKEYPVGTHFSGMVIFRAPEQSPFASVTSPIRRKAIRRGRSVMEKTPEHNERIVKQFTKQAAYFARLPGDPEAAQWFVQCASVNSADVILDVACGAGTVACAAARIARQVTGIDLTAAMIEQAERLQTELGLSNLSWHLGNVNPLPYAGESFTAVLTRYSFHHFLDPVAVLAEMVRVCQPGGRVLVADLLLPPAKIEAYDCMERIRDPSHVTVLTESELLGMFTRAGLVAIQKSGYLFDLKLRQLLEASFSNPGDAERVRAIFEADVGLDRLGIGVHRKDGEIQFAYPISIVIGTKPPGIK